MAKILPGALGSRTAWLRSIHQHPQTRPCPRVSTSISSLSLSKITAQILEGQESHDQDGPQPMQELAESDVSAAIRQRQRDFTLVETPKQLQAMLQELSLVDNLAIDCEGVLLGQPQGQLCLLQLAARQSSHKAAASSGAKPPPASSTQPAKPKPTQPKQSSPSHTNSTTHTPASPAPPARPPSHATKKGGGPPLLMYIVDVHQLQWRAFHYRLNPADPRSLTLKALLESPQLTKLVYDVRSDAANLMQQFDIRMKGVYDLQLAEVAVRQLRGIPAKWVLPLDKSLSACLPRSTALDQDLVHGQNVAKHYHKGNRTEVWQARPLTEELLQYAVSDVRYLHLLADALNQHLPPSVVSKVRTATIMRLKMGAMPGVARASAPEIVLPSDIRQLTQQARDVQGARGQQQQQ